MHRLLQVCPKLDDVGAQRLRWMCQYMPRSPRRRWIEVVAPGTRHVRDALVECCRCRSSSWFTVGAWRRCRWRWRNGCKRTRDCKDYVGGSGRADTAWKHILVKLALLAGSRWWSIIRSQWCKSSRLGPSASTDRTRCRLRSRGWSTVLAWLVATGTRTHKPGNLGRRRPKLHSCSKFFWKVTWNGW